MCENNKKISVIFLKCKREQPRCQLVIVIFLMYDAFNKRGLN